MKRNEQVNIISKSLEQLVPIETFWNNYSNFLAASEALPSADEYRKIFLNSHAEMLKNLNMILDRGIYELGDLVSVVIDSEEANGKVIGFDLIDENLKITIETDNGVWFWLDPKDLRKNYIEKVD
jgi:hypothetical protein